MDINLDGNTLVNGYFAGIVTGGESTMDFDGGLITSDGSGNVTLNSLLSFPIVIGGDTTYNLQQYGGGGYYLAGIGNDGGIFLNSAILWADGTQISCPETGTPTVILPNAEVNGGVYVTPNYGSITAFLGIDDFAGTPPANYAGIDGAGNIYGNGQYIAGIIISGGNMNFDGGLITSVSGIISGVGFDTENVVIGTNNFGDNFPVLRDDDGYVGGMDTTGFIFGTGLNINDGLTSDSAGNLIANTLGSTVGVTVGLGGGPGFLIADGNGLLYPAQAPTASAPAYVLGAMYFDTTLNKLRIGGASGWETVTSV